MEEAGGRKRGRRTSSRGDGASRKRQRVASESRGGTDEGGEADGGFRGANAALDEQCGLDAAAAAAVAAAVARLPPVVKRNKAAPARRPSLKLSQAAADAARAAAAPSREQQGLDDAAAAAVAAAVAKLPPVVKRPKMKAAGKARPPGKLQPAGTQAARAKPRAQQQALKAPKALSASATAARLGAARQATGPVGAGSRGRGAVWRTQYLGMSRLAQHQRRVAHREALNTANENYLNALKTGTGFPKLLPKKPPNSKTTHKASPDPPSNKAAEDGAEADEAGAAKPKQATSPSSARKNGTGKGGLVKLRKSCHVVSPPSVVKIEPDATQVNASLEVLREARGPVFAERLAGICHSLSCRRFQRWCVFEWFYSTMDEGFYRVNDFEHAILRFGEETGLMIAARPRMTRAAWAVLRGALLRRFHKRKAPRRFSARFVAEQRKGLRQYREQVLSLQQGTPLEVDVEPMPSYKVPHAPVVGARVTCVHDKSYELATGVILSLDRARGTSLVQYDIAAFGCRLVPNTQLRLQETKVILGTMYDAVRLDLLHQLEEQEHASAAKEEDADDLDLELPQPLSATKSPAKAAAPLKPVFKLERSGEEVVKAKANDDAADKAKGKGKGAKPKTDDVDEDGETKKKDTHRTAQQALQQSLSHLPRGAGNLLAGPPTPPGNFVDPELLRHSKSDPKRIVLNAAPTRSRALLAREAVEILEGTKPHPGPGPPESDGAERTSEKEPDPAAHENRVKLLAAPEPGEATSVEEALQRALMDKSQGSLLVLIESLLDLKETIVREVRALNNAAEIFLASCDMQRVPESFFSDTVESAAHWLNMAVANVDRQLEIALAAAPGVVDESEASPQPDTAAAAAAADLGVARPGAEATAQERRAAAAKLLKRVGSAEDDPKKEEDDDLAARCLALLAAMRDAAQSSSGGDSKPSETLVAAMRELAGPLGSQLAALGPDGALALEAIEAITGPLSLKNNEANEDIVSEGGVVSDEAAMSDQGDGEGEGDVVSDGGTISDGGLAPEDTGKTLTRNRSSSSSSLPSVLSEESKMSAVSAASAELPNPPGGSAAARSAASVASAQDDTRSPMSLSSIPDEAEEDEEDEEESEDHVDDDDDDDDDDIDDDIDDGDDKAAVAAAEERNQVLAKGAAARAAAARAIALNNAIVKGAIAKTPREEALPAVLTKRRVISDGATTSDSMPGSTGERAGARTSTRTAKSGTEGRGGRGRGRGRPRRSSRSGDLM